MACFVVPAVEAVVTTVAEKVIEKKANQGDVKVKNGFSGKLKWLNNMLWGGSTLLAFEHIWHGEIVPWFPFLTNTVNSVSRAEMLHEMVTSGVGMAVLVTGVWIAIVIASNVVEKRSVEKFAVSQEV